MNSRTKVVIPKPKNKSWHLKSVRPCPTSGRNAKCAAHGLRSSGRIVAQLLGAVATIGLGVVFLHKYQDTRVSTPSVVQAAPRVARVNSSHASIAVLPMANFSADAREQYVADGMTEALIAGLAQIDSLRVISRTSMMRYKTTERSLPEIADELAVDLIVEGSIVKAGDRVRVIAQLIDAKTDEHIWAGSYDQTAGDILAVQSKVATTIARDVTSALQRTRFSSWSTLPN